MKERSRGPVFGDPAFKFLKGHARPAPAQPLRGEMRVLQIVQMAQDRLADVKAFGTPGPLGERFEAFLDFRGEAESQHRIVRVARRV
jgi:hypothetical protein